VKALALEIDEMIDRLGGPVESFRPDRSNVFAGFIIGSLCIAAGILLAGFLVQTIVIRGGNLALKDHAAISTGCPSA
jgi:hypothetical protein